MLLHEANARLKKQITADELDKIHTLYCLLDLSKDDFCKIVDAVGVETLASNYSLYKRLDQADREFKSKRQGELAYGASRVIIRKALNKHPIPQNTYVDDGTSKTFYPNFL